MNSKKYYVYLSNRRIYVVKTTKEIMSFFYNNCPCIEEYMECSTKEEALDLQNKYNKESEDI